MIIFNKNLARGDAGGELSKYIKENHFIYFEIPQAAACLPAGRDPEPY